ncbi:MAG: CPBP family intramembrane metalloprotease [Bacteroidales bacterium]|nr:CPBP family intramembrane metalloprotease [Bacteroidales bacterium]
MTTTSCQMNNRYSTALRPGLGLGLLFCIFVLMMVVVGLATQVITAKFGATTPSLRIMAVIQDVLLFMLPPIVTAMMMTRYPAEFLELMTSPRWTRSLLTLALVLASIPLMNVIVEWNKQVEFLGQWEWMREMEEGVEATMKVMMGEPTGGSLLVCVLIFGVLTGLAEELFFRGGVQKLLLCMRVNKHVAIWTTAFIFSLFHLQFYGFVPRMLMGACFGYLMLWSGSLWLPVIAHAFNNSMVAFTTWLADRGTDASQLDYLGTTLSPIDIVWVVASVALTAWILRLIYIQSKNKTC